MATKRSRGALTAADAVSRGRTPRVKAPIVHITQLRLRNWRNFRAVDLALQPRIFVAGPNASGKSNLFDALRFLHDIARPDGNLVRAMNDRGGIERVRSLHARKESNVRIEVELRIGDERWSYALELSGTKSRPVEVVTEVITRGGCVLEDRKASAEGPRLREQAYLQQASKSDAYRPLVDALSALRFLHVVPQVARGTGRSDEAGLRLAPGSDFIDQLARLPKRSQTVSLGRIERVLRVAVPRFSALKLERDDVGRPHLLATYEHWRPQGSWQNEVDFSDGTLRLIGLLWAIDQGVAPLILEEPELSLHRDVTGQLPRMLARLALRSGRQFLVSTHAEEMLSDPTIDPSEVVLLEPSGSHETTATLGSSRPELVAHAVAGLPIGRLITGMTRPREVDQLSLPLGSRR